MNVIQLQTMIKETPELMPFIFKKLEIDNVNLFDLLEELKETPYFWESSSNMMEKVNSWLWERVENTKEIERKLSLIHRYFDWLFAIKDSSYAESFQDNLQTSLNKRDINKIVSLYFDILVEFEKKSKSQEETDKFETFCFYAKGHLNNLQSTLKTILHKTTQEKFVVFEVMLRQKEKQGLVIFENKKLPPLSKMNKDGYMALFKEVNLFSFEDAEKLFKSYFRKYKLEDLPLAEEIKEKFLIKKGLGSLKTDTDVITVKTLLKPSSVLPQYPFFPYTEKTESEFFQALKEDILQFSDSPYRNFVLLLALVVRAKELGIPFELTDDEISRSVAIEEKLINLIETELTLTEVDGMLEHANVSKFLNMKIEVEKEQYDLSEFFDIWTRKKIRQVSVFGHRNTETVSLDFLDKSRRRYHVDITTLQLHYYSVLKGKDKALYEKVLGNFAQEYSLAKYIGKPNGNTYKNEFFEDVAFYQVEKGLINEKDALVLIGEKFSHYSQYELDYKEKFINSDKKVQQALLEQLIEFGSEYRNRDFYEWKRTVYFNSSLNRRNSLKFFCAMKPTLLKNLIAFKTGLMLNDEKRTLIDYADKMNEEEMEKLLQFIMKG